MNSFRWPSALLVCLAFTVDARAQFGFGPPAPGGVGFGSGIRFHYHRRNLSAAGVFGGGYVVPINPYFGPPPVYYGVAPYGLSSTRLTINYLAAPGTLYYGPRPARPLADDYDLSGVDLDVEPPPRAVVPGKKTVTPPAPAKQPPAPPKQPAPVQPSPPAGQAPQTSQGLPPGVDVSKPKQTIRPGDAAQPSKDGKQKTETKTPSPPPPPAPSLPKDEPVEESARLVQLGLTAFGQEEYGLAAQRFHRALSIHPENVRAHFLLSQAQFALGKFRQAVTTIEAGMNLDPKWPRAAFHPRLELYKGIEADFDLHLKRLQDAADKSVEVYAFQFLLGHQLWFDGRRAEAVVIFRKARPLAADPVFVDAFLKAAEPGLVAVK